MADLYNPPFTHDASQNLQESIQTSHRLLDIYTRVMSQTEHTRRLLLDGQWEMSRVSFVLASGTFPLGETCKGSGADTIADHHRAADQSDHEIHHGPLTTTILQDLEEIQAAAEAEIRAKQEEEERIRREKREREERERREREELERKGKDGLCQPSSLSLPILAQRHFVLRQSGSVLLAVQ